MGTWREMLRRFIRRYIVADDPYDPTTIADLAEQARARDGCHLRIVTMPDEEKARVLSRNETHDLGMIIKERTKVLKAHAEQQAAACMAQFEKQLSAVYSWDQDENWKQAAERAETVVKESQAVIAKRCEELGIPRTFAPMIGLSWQNRGENMMSQRRAELRRVAKTSIEAMTAAAITKIEKQGLDLRTQIVAMGLYSPEAKMFLESLAPIEEAMTQIDFVEVEKKLEREEQQRLADRRRLGY
jgi:hypothetical protein